MIVRNAEWAFLTLVPQLGGPRHERPPSFCLVTWSNIMSEIDGTEVPDCPEGVLPPRPWDWVAALQPNSNRYFNIYLTDATGRKIASVWGPHQDRPEVAKAIVHAVNEKYPP